MLRCAIYGRRNHYSVRLRWLQRGYDGFVVTRASIGSEIRRRETPRPVRAAYTEAASGRVGNLVTLNLKERYDDTGVL